MSSPAVVYVVDGFVRVVDGVDVLDRFDLTQGSRELDRWLDRWRNRAGVRVLIPARGTVALAIADATIELASTLWPEQLRLDV